MSLFATLGLIAVTLAYVIFNWRMVREMRETRKLSVLPKLAIRFTRVGPAHALVAVKNVGPGAALDVRNDPDVRAARPIEAAAHRLTNFPGLSELFPSHYVHIGGDGAHERSTALP
jgi:hypothetical protein